MRLILTPWHWQQVCIHAESVYPEECCGLLLGTRNLEETPDITAIWPTHNVWDQAQQQDFASLTGQNRSGARSRNFTIAPTALLQAGRVARAQGWDIMGIYHSHPDHPAQPSAFDRAIAWEQYIYLILSVTAGQVTRGRVWQLDSTDVFQELTLQVTPPLT
ncbi:MAG: M67 family metallopeptidase [Cyanobacteria bacterium P01_G01_bin.54]